MITHDIRNLHKNEMKKVTKLEEKIGKIKAFEGRIIGEYGARITAIMADGRKQAFEISCGKLGAFDKEVHNDANADFSSYKMNWGHMLDASINTPERWRNIGEHYEIQGDYQDKVRDELFEG